MKKYINVNELKSIQLEILESIDKFCTNNNIQYFLSYGTLIGAIRHKGYIPWDDDIDICMPRPDYEYFLSHYNHFNSIYKVINHSNTPLYTLPYAKVHDTRTIMNETMYHKDSFGVYIDIFPLDGVKDKNKGKKMIRYRHLLNTKRAVWSKHRKTYKNLIILLGKICLLPFTTDHILSKMDSLAKEDDYNNSKYINSLFTTTAYKGNAPKRIFEEYLISPFEHLKCRIPKGYDEYLRIIYGDYMQLPPIEKRVSHHVFKAWWK